MTIAEQLRKISTELNDVFAESVLISNHLRNLRDVVLGIASEVDEKDKAEPDS